MTDMQPQNLEYTPGPENLPPTPPVSGERVPVLPAPEAGIETGVERKEQVAEASAVAADAAGVAVPTAPPVVIPDDAAQAAPATVSGPAIAADEDVIEKEWVDRAKKIVQDTQDNPYERSNQVTALQRDYQKKRYGRETKAA